jgi:hypothetical protein
MATTPRRGSSQWSCSPPPAGGEVEGQSPSKQNLIIDHIVDFSFETIMHGAAPPPASLRRRSLQCRRRRAMPSARVRDLDRGHPPQPIVAAPLRAAGLAPPLLCGRWLGLAAPPLATYSRRCSRPLPTADRPRRRSCSAAGGPIVGLCAAATAVAPPPSLRMELGSNILDLNTRT